MESKGILFGIKKWKKKYRNGSEIIFILAGKG
jgi:hypothetical protein